MSKKIVVIDDEQDILEIVKAILKTKGYTLYGATNGEDGWRTIQQQKPDLIIADLKMPKVSGMELTNRIHASEDLKHIPIIIMSAIGKESGKPDEFWRNGLKSDDFISKPFDPLDLLGRVEYIFRKQNYISNKPNTGKPQAPPTPDRSETIPPPKPPKAPIKDMSPENVVKTFVESWNTRNFAEEYHCLDSEMNAGMDEQNYVQSRMQAYQSSNGEYLKQRVIKIEESNIRRNLAKVIIIREDTQGAQVRKSRQTYALKKTFQGWKIVSVRSKSI